MNVDFANQADTRSFCPPGHTSRPAFSSAPSECVSQPPGSLKGAPRPKATWGLQQQLRGLSAKCLPSAPGARNVEPPVQGPEGSTQEKWPQQEEVTR